MEQIDVGGINVDVEFKDIKNIHLSVHPPTGRVRISAPERMNLDTIQMYAISKLAWIKKHQKQFQKQERETQREYLDIESHYVWGQRYLLKVKEKKQAPTVDIKHKELILTIRPGSSQKKKEEVIYAWYRQQLREEATPLINKWEEVLGVKVNHCYIQRMKTKWGSCNHQSRNIRLNSELAKKPKECLEYIILHELLHLLEPTHNAAFVSLMDRYMPHWQHIRDELNSMPLSHVEWGY